MSAPFIGAYAWIMPCGRNGTITNFLLNTFGFKLGDIYGFKGCVIVMSLQLYSLVFMFVSGAFKNLDNSLIEASESLGCSGVRKIFKIVLPLILPTLLSGALMVFMRTFADYGTPDAHRRKLQHPAGRRLQGVPLRNRFERRHGRGNFHHRDCDYDDGVPAAKVHRQPQGVLHERAASRRGEKSSTA